MGEGDPKPEYCARDMKRIFKCNRRTIASRWNGQEAAYRSNSPCPMPWDVCDFGYIQPFARPESLTRNWDFEVVAGRLRLRHRGLAVWVRSTSDLAVSSWSSYIKHGWLSYLADAHGMYSEFADLVAAGTVHIYEDDDVAAKDVSCVLFDVPIPAVGRDTLVRL
ncbi:unnamed protein product [Chondrus crispus]|uniref:Uncharacterized protein n=1 Tax=Chondrus crispus TaxID=2769 RepID=R7Q558_CHOCR|nr:unnamed protein product [Chondrus crispus]CDF33692.1 unnamed protein product [Chondrus crispus]|eukprot:XP_005713511.1 unnamed protein product [Chondrus crispus]